MRTNVSILEMIIDNQDNEIKKLKIELSKKLNDDKKTELLIQNDVNFLLLNKKIDVLASFSHSVSDQVKKLTAEIRTVFDNGVIQRITDFLQESINSLEEILSDHFKTEVRASIKLTNGFSTVRTFVRGANNIKSRGGEYRSSELNLKNISIDENYSYNAIVFRGEQFFASGNLVDLKNKFEPNDEFYCEYGDDYYNIFTSTIVVPIRIPHFGVELEQEILGLICIDTKIEIPEWSEGYQDIKESRAYHIIADYADSLAMLIKEYSDAEKYKK